MIDLDRNPKVRLVVDHIRELIEVGDLIDGTTLPSASKVALRLGVSSGTALVAYRYMVSTDELTPGRHYRVKAASDQALLFGVEDRVFNWLKARIESGQLPLGSELLPRKVASEFGCHGATAQFALLRLVDLGYLEHRYTGASYAVRSHEQDLGAVTHLLPEALLTVLEGERLQAGAELPSMVTLTKLVARNFPGVHYLSVRRAEHYLAAIGKLTKLPSGRFTLAA